MTARSIAHLDFYSPTIHPSWVSIISSALGAVDSAYLKMLKNTTDWLPGPTRIFNAFSLPLPHLKYILFGESPYPRPESANGYAFWDGRVGPLWGPAGLESRVNRATSLRNMVKMLLVAQGLLSPQDTSQTTIARLNKVDLVQTGGELFENFIDKGFLLLNASLVLSPSRKVQQDACAWRRFMEKLLEMLCAKNKHLTLILFGKIAKQIDALPASMHFEKIYAEHPYNLSFIQNQAVIDFFRPLHLLKAI